ncbi:MAG TPA: tRNA lysidine(34) synthetase TilS [Firmicutes bacterium]|nr:tRNA lysidine(34) synthetase TilS [Bacillota bacterium]
MGDLLGRVRRTVERYRMLAPGETVVAAVSGGPDSVALAHLLLRLSEEYSLSLHVAHLNHRFRGAEAEAEARFVAELAERWGLPVTVGEEDVPAHLARCGGSAEAVARRFRYAFLERVADSVGAVRIALGHQADDQAETVLMNLLRGAGPRGLGGMPPVRGGRYIRPLLQVSRREIMAYLAEQGLPYRLDPSNASRRFFRNRIRHDLLPYLEREFAPGLRAILSRTADLLQAEDEYLEGVAATARGALLTPTRAGRSGREMSTGYTGSCRALAELPLALLRRMIRQLWRELAGLPGDAEEAEGLEEAAARPDGPRLGYERVEAVVELIREGRTGARLQLPGGVTVRRVYDRLFWETARQGGAEPAGSPGARGRAEPEGLPAPVELRVPGETFISQKGLVLSAEIRAVSGAGGASRLVAEAKAAGPWRAVLDADRLSLPLMVRSRRPGDRFWPLGAPGERKLKDYLIERKIPPEERKGLLLVADEGGRRPVWLIGERPAEPLRVTGETKRILVLQASFREL